MAVEYLSGQMRITGLTENGSTFDDMITQLKKIEMMQANKLSKWKQDWQLRQEAFRQVRTQLQSLRTVCNEMNTMDKFMIKTASSSNSSVASATAKSSAMTGGADEIEVGQLAQNAIWSIASSAEKIGDVVNNSAVNQTFSYEYAGETRTITVPPGTTLENFRNLVNNDSKNLGVQVNLIRSGSTYTMQMKGKDTGSENNMKVLYTDVDGLSGGTYPSYSGYYTTSHTAATDIVNTHATDNATFKYSYGGKSMSVTIGPQATLQDLVTAINSDPNKPAGVTASLDTVGGNMALRFTSTDGTPVSVSTESFSGVNFADGPVVDTAGTATGWHTQDSKDCWVRVNGWPTGDWIVKDKNTVDDVIPGVTVTVKDVGKSTISVDTDTEKITENVVKFVDAINEFRTLIQDLTKIDENKNRVRPEYADSLYEMQTGSILTGNYGVQLLSSQIKQATAGMPKGFRALLEVDGTKTGDIYTSLSQIGIKTNAEGSGGENFGLLVLNDDDKLPMLEKVLKDNPMAVAEFFAAKDVGVSDSPDFSYADSLGSITRPGSYEVKYTVQNGKVVDDDPSNPPTINGKPAKVNEDGSISLLRADPTSTDSGVAIAVTDGRADYEYEIEVDNIATHSQTLVETLFTSRDTAIHSETSDQTFQYTFNGQTRIIDVPPGATLDDLVRTINRDKGNPGVTASVIATSDSPPKYNLQMQAKDSGVTDVISVTTAGIATMPPGAISVTQTGEDAVWRYRPTNPPGGTWTEKTTSTNKMDIAPGLTVTLRGPGNTTIKAVKHNDADGMTIRPDNLTDGDYSGTVRLKQGKIGEILELLNGVPGKTEEGMLGTKGALQILEDNYDHIIKGINEKLEREDARIIKWERTIRNRFARLEATLKTYEGLTKTLESQIKQLGSNSK